MEGKDGEELRAFRQIAIKYAGLEGYNGTAMAEEFDRFLQKNLKKKLK